MIDYIKKCTNFKNCTKLTFMNCIELYKKEALSSCDESMYSSVEKLFDEVYKKSDIDLCDFIKTYCYISLAKLTRNVVYNSKNYNECNELKQSMLYLSLKQHLQIYKYIEKTNFEYYDPIYKFYMLNMLTNNTCQSNDDLVEKFNLTEQIMKKDDIDNEFSQFLSVLPKKERNRFNNLENYNTFNHLKHARYLNFLYKIDHDELKNVYCKKM